MIRILRTGPPVLSLALLLVVLPVIDARYLVVQAGYVLDDLFGARRFAAVTAPTPEEEELFSRVRAVRQFGIAELGLSETRAYTRYKRVEREALVWVVSGVRELSWERHLWDYPLVGALPYRGYYREPDAAREAERLRASGYDALYRRVTAFSFLGFLPDPLYSFALERSYASLADLILHEMTHAALFVRGQGSFNENLASFLGTEGARQFIEATYGVGSDEYRQMMTRREELAAARALMLRLQEELRALYDRLPADVPRTEARLRKRAVIERFQADLAEEYDTLFQTDAFRWLTEMELSNAVVDLYVTYGSDQNRFDELLSNRGGSIPTLLRDLKAIRPAIAEQGMAALEALDE